MLRNLVWGGFIALSSFILVPSTSNADVVLFDFLNGTALDGAGVPTSMTGAVTGTLNTTLTVNEILAPEYADPDGDGVWAATGNIFTAADGNTTNINGNANALGVNNFSINNGNFDTLNGGTTTGTEANDFNSGESIIFTFDEDVQFTEIEFESGTESGTLFDVFVNGTSLVTLTQPDGNVTALGTLSSTTILAGQQVEFAVTGPVDQVSLRIESFTVDTISSATIPEPTSLAFVSLLGLGFVTRRRR